MPTDVSEKRTASIFTVKEPAQQLTQLFCFLRLIMDSEYVGNISSSGSRDSTVGGSGFEFR
jgi:hypothetical protein